MTARLLADVLKELKAGATPLQCAMRFDISRATAYRYRANASSGRPGRPRSLTPGEEAVVCKVYMDDEATVSELACILQVTTQTIRNVLRRYNVW